MKTQPKYPIGGYAPGNYLCNCVNCKTEFQGDKRAVQCEYCAVRQEKIDRRIQFPEFRSIQMFKEIMNIGKAAERNSDEMNSHNLERS
jgi:hypothetical protein